jgi:hypothetical protein
MTMNGEETGTRVSSEGEILIEDGLPVVLHSA